MAGGLTMPADLLGFDEEERLREYKDRLFACANLRPIHQQWLADQDYYGGDQYAPGDKQKLEDEDRAAVVVNLIRKTIDAVSGAEIINRFEPRLIARTVETADRSLSNQLDDTVRYIRQVGRMSYPESIAYRDTAIGGLGALEYFYDYSKGANGRVCNRWLPITELGWDPQARGPNLDDIRWVIRARYMSKGDFDKLFPENEVDFERLADDPITTQHAAMWPLPEIQEPHDASRRHLYEHPIPAWNPRRREVLVYEEQWFETEYEITELDEESGEERTFDEDEWSAYTAAKNVAGELPGMHVREPKDRYYRAFWVGEEMIELQRMEVDRFTYKFLTGFRMVSSEGGVKFFGMVKAAKHAQDITNKMLGGLVYAISTNPKGAMFAPPSMFEDPDTVSDDWAAPSAYIPTEEDADFSQMKIVTGVYPDSFERAMELAMNLVPVTTGVPPYFSGDVDDLRRTAGSAVSQITQATDRVLAALQDSLQLYREQSGDLLLQFIRVYFPEGEVVRITGEDGQVRPTPFERAWVDDIEYDVIVTDAPKTKTQMREFWASLMQTNSFELMVQLELLDGEDIAEIMPDIPEFMRERMKARFAAKRQAAEQAAAEEEAAVATQQMPPESIQ